MTRRPISRSPAARRPATAGRDAEPVEAVLAEDPIEQEKPMPDLEADIRQLREDVAALARQISATGEHSYVAARRAAADGIEQLREQGQATLDTLRTSARDVEAEVIRSVREKPVTALAIAAGIGYLVALLTRR